jgi:hypothetical protein
VSRDRSTAKRGKTESQPAPAAEQPKVNPPDNERVGNVRRGAESTPKDAAASDAGARKANGNDARREGDVRRDRSRAAGEKENDRERKVDREAAGD